MPQPATRQFSGIFISYRRDDSAGHAGRLFDRLSAHFGEDQVFMDIDNIEPGEDFVQVLEEAVGSCEILLTVIGRRWLLSADGTSRRLDNPNDFVRLEIAAALKRNIRVIPVLVQGATMPGSQDLPDDLSHFSRRHALELSDQRWRHDIDRLIVTLDKVIAERKEARRRAAQEEEEERQRHAAAEEQKRRKVEEERQREAEESARASQGAEKQTREHGTAAPTAAATPPVSKPEAKSRGLIIVGAGLALVVVGVVAVWLSGAVGKRGARESGQQAAGGTNAGQTSEAQTGRGATGRPAAPEGMLYVPGGEFMMGRDDGDEYERPAHSVTIKPFFIDIYEVTNEEYEKFVKDTGHRTTMEWKGRTYPKSATRKPVTGVTWDDARRFAEWRSRRDGGTYRLPTEEEWEFAARGTDGRRYPWGNEWRAGLANANGASRGMADVGAYKGSSPFGVFDMVGNVWEWTDSGLKAYPGGQLPEQPASNAKVLRGGSYKSDKTQATATYRFGWRASGEASYAETGFRCVKDIANTPAVP